MEPSKQSKFFTVAALILSFGVAANAALPEITPKDLSVVLQSASIQDRIYIQKQVLEYTASILRVPPTQVMSQRQILAQDVLDLSEKDTTDQEKRVLLIWAEMVEKKTLRGNIEALINSIKNSPTPAGEKIRATPQMYISYAQETLASSIEAVVKMRGLTADSKKNSYIEWSQLSERMLTKLNQPSAEPQNLLQFSASRWLKTQAAEFLIDGPASFAKREMLMSQAQNTINILTWSVYDDVTGTELADQLLALKNKNKKLKIRIIVDGQVARGTGRNAQLKRMQDGDIEVVHWFNSANNYMGQHRKMIIIDNEHLVAGGLNYGDVYSHKNPDLKVSRWRDTDIYLQGAGAQEGNHLFAKLWNQQLSEQKHLKYTKMRLSNQRPSPDKAGIEISIIDHEPTGATEASNIMMTILKAIRSAKATIDIQNAYIILFPTLKTELQNAIKRNVRVRILTNSGQSVDEPIVSIPILRSVLEFVKMGAEVYVKKGATLHSKLIVVDSEFSMIMSYNLHPRSERVEGEMAIAVKDPQFAAGLLEVFGNDISEEKAQHIKQESDLILPSSPVAVPTLRLFFDML